MPESIPHCTFSTGEPALADLLTEAATGKLQLPDFQRGWVWDDNHIRSLLASVSLSYPIGAVMLLETGGNGVRFKPRRLEGATFPDGTLPERLILDGQQRLTSLFLALKSGKPVPTKTDKKQRIDRFYYLDIAKCLNEAIDRMDAVVSLPPDRKQTADFGRTLLLDASTQEKEFELRLIPLAVLMDARQFSDWRRAYHSKYRQDTERLDQFDAFETEVYQRFLQYRVPTIEMKKQTPKEAVCQVFEKVNTGGVTLTVFELLTATFAADDFNLREDWDARRQRLKRLGPMKDVSSTDFLTSLTLLASYKRSREAIAEGNKEVPSISCKRKDVLNLEKVDYCGNADLLEAAMERVARFLVREKVFDTRNLAYATQLIPLSAICAVLGDRFEDDAVRAKLARWYWSGVFGEMYGGANESRYAFDIVEVLEWIDGGANEPRTIRDSNFAPIRLLSLQTRNSAAYKGLMVLLMQHGSLDLLNGDPIELTSYFDEAVDIHHLFPRAYCEANNLPRERWNSVVNKAPLTAKTNRKIGGQAPSAYLAQIQQHGIPETRMDEILRSHAIDPALMRTDDFYAFIRARAGALLDLIEKATGKQIAGRDSEETLGAYDGPLSPRQVL